MPNDASSAASYATATDNLRTAARWLLTAAAAAGAVLVAGVQLTSIGSLGPGDWPRLLAAAGGLAVGLGAVGYMILQASLLLTNQWITLADLELDQFRRQLRNSGRRRDKRRVAEIDHIYLEVQSCREEFYGSVAESVSDLYQRLAQANKEARESPSPEHARAAADVKAAVETIVAAANYSYTRAEFAALRRSLALAWAVFIAGIVVFAYTANPPKPSGATTPAKPAATQQAPAPGAAAPSPSLNATGARPLAGRR